VRDLCVRRRREELLDCAALVGLEVREGDPPQLLQGPHAGYFLRDQREQPLHPRVIEQRLFRVQ